MKRMLAIFAVVFLLLGGVAEAQLTTQDAINKIAAQVNDTLGLRTYLSLADLEPVVIVDGYDLPAASYMTFPLPLVPMGDHNYAAVSFSASAWPDTVFYQITLANSMMDSMTTVFDFGTNDDHAYMRYFLPGNFGADIASLCQYLENAGAGWIPTGAYFSAAHYTVVAQNEDGYPATAKYIGVRVGSDADEGISDLQIILHLGTVGESAGD